MATSPRPAPLDHVGVRELRQNLSVYLERVVAGESLEVTDRGRAVAMLVPLAPTATLVDRLIVSGRAAPATRRLEDVPRLQSQAHRGLGARAAGTSGTSGRQGVSVLPACLDSSAIMKLILPEPESTALEVALEEWPHFLSSELASVEFRRSLRRIGASSAVERRADGVLKTIIHLRLDEAVLRLAAAAHKLKLRVVQPGL